MGLSYEQEGVTMIRMVLAGAAAALILAGAAGTAQAAEPLTVSLDECIDHALRENLGLKTTVLGLRTGDYSIIKAESVFDPSISLSVSRDESHTPNFLDYISVSAITQKRSSAQLTYGQALSTGADWGLGIYNTMSESNIEIQKNYTSYVGMQVNQPLLRGFGRRVNRSGIYLARLDRDSDVHVLRQQASNLVYDVIASYWTLAYDRRTLDVRRLSLAQADSLLAYNRKGLELGVLVESDVLEAQSERLRRQQELLDQESAIRDDEDTLRRLLNVVGADEWEGTIITGDEFPEQVSEPDPEVVLEDALANRPEYLGALTTIERAALTETVAENRARPGLDLNAQYRLNGSGATYGKDIEKLGNADAYGWNVGLLFSYPLRNRSAHADLEQRRIDRRRAELSLKDLEQTIAVELRTATRNIASTRERIEVARMEVEVNERKLRMEEERFRNHLSTSYFVLQFQRDLANARGNLNRAVVDRLVAVAAFERARGTLLGDRDISILGMSE